MIFPEEQAVLTELLAEWYKAIKEFTESADKIFSERGKRLDQHSPPWMRHNFPEGYSHEIGKKIERVKQLLQGGPSGREAPLGKMVYGSEILDELRDICNYSRMMGAVLTMLDRRVLAEKGPFDVPGAKARKARKGSGWPRGGPVLTPENIEEAIGEFGRWLAREDAP